MSHYGKCKHGIYLGGCRECFSLPKLTKVGEELIQELVECFNEDKEMTANELADLNEWSCCAQSKQVSAMLRQQAKEIEELKERLEETRQLYLKQLAITHSDTQSHPIEPVAMRYDFDGYGYMYIDSGSGSDWQTRKKVEFLYTKPFFSQKPVAMMVKMDGFDKPEFTTICSSDALKHPNYTALYDHPMRELTDEEINKLWAESHEDGIAMQQGFTTQQHYFAHLILRKASEK